MTTRQRGALLAGLSAVGLMFTGLALPVPYTTLSPNAPDNTLGTTAGGKPLISFGAGAPAVTEPVGQLQLTTVLERTQGLDLLQALRDWLSSDQAVVPLQAVRQPGQTEQQSRAQDAQQMSASRASAVTAAFAYLGRLKVTLADGPQAGATVASAVVRTPGQPDRPLPLRSAAQLPLDLQACPTGSTLLAVLTGQAAPGPVLSGCDHRTPGGKAVATVGLTDTAPFSVDFNLPGVGGPSAGLMFALGIVAKLSPSDITGGQVIAGTGEISDAGLVGPIGGIQQKVIGARKLGHAQFFLVPAANCAEALGAPRGSVRLVRVTSLDDALSSLALIAARRTAELPRC